MADWEAETFVRGPVESGVRGGGKVQQWRRVGGAGNNCNGRPDSWLIHFFFWTISPRFYFLTDSLKVVAVKDVRMTLAFGDQHWHSGGCFPIGDMGRQAGLAGEQLKHSVLDTISSFGQWDSSQMEMLCNKQVYECAAKNNSGLMTV